MTIEEFRDIKIAYIRRTGKYGAGNKQLMYKLKKYLKSNDLPIRSIDSRRYAIFEVAHTENDVSNFWKNIDTITSDLLLNCTKPTIERYAFSKISSHLCEFCIPLK